jgi:hypothetical protein
MSQYIFVSFSVNEHPIRSALSANEIFNNWNMLDENFFEVHLKFNLANLCCPLIPTVLLQRYGILQTLELFLYV